MKKTRIVKRTSVDNSITYVIQQRHFLFKWWWVDAWINSLCGAYCTDSFSTLEEAERKFCYFDNSKVKNEIIKEV